MAPEPTSDRLYAVAAGLFAEHGYDSTSVRMVADALGIKAGSLYYYIRSKEELLYDVINGALNRLIDGVLPTMNSHLGPTEKLWCALNIHIRVGCGTRNEMLVTIRETGKLSSEHSALILNKRRLYEHMFEEVVKAGVRSGDFNQMEERLTSYLLLGMANWVCQTFNPSGALSIDEFSRLGLSLLFDGLITSNDRGRSARFDGTACGPTLLGNLVL